MSSTEPGWTSPSSAGRRAIVWSAAISRTIGSWRSASRAALGREQPIDDRDPRLPGGDIRLGLLDARGDGGFLRARLKRLIRFARGGALELRRPRGGSLGLGLGLGEALPAGRILRVCAADAVTMPPARARPPASIPPHAAPSLMRSTFAMIGMVGKDAGRAPQLLGEHRAGQQMRPGRAAERRAADRPCARSASSKPSAAPIRKRASRTPSSRHALEPLGERRRGERFAGLVEHDRSGCPARAAGILPPVSGSSVIRTGQASRFT